MIPMTIIIEEMMSDSGDDSPSRQADFGEELPSLAAGEETAKQTAIIEESTLANEDVGEASMMPQPTTSLWDLINGPASSSDGNGARCAAIQTWEQVESQQACQEQAVAAGHNYYQFQNKADGGLCGTAPYCYDTLSVPNPWCIFKKPFAVECTCDNGHPAESRFCPSAQAKCAWCHDGYSLAQGLCEPTILWSPLSEQAQTCSMTKKLIVEDQRYCQELAIRKRHRFYVYNSKKKKCWTGRYCSIIQKDGWKVYPNPVYEAQPIEKKNLDVVRYDWKRPFSHICPQWSESLPHQEQYLRVHNYFRCLHDVEPLLWDLQMENNALAAAKHSAKLRVLTHTSSYRDFDSSENLAAGTSRTTATTAWYDEILHRDYAWPGDESWKQTGHFTAMIWKSSTKLGCGEVFGEGYAAVHACHYSGSPSNIQGLYEKNVPSTEWVNDPQFCCRDTFTEDLCDSECQLQWHRPPPQR